MFFMALRHLVLAEAQECVEGFVRNNPAAASLYGKTTSTSISDIKEQMFEIVDGKKIVTHQQIMFSLAAVYEKRKLEIIADFEDVIYFLI